MKYLQTCTRQTIHAQCTNKSASPYWRQPLNHISPTNQLAVSQVADLSTRRTSLLAETLDLKFSVTNRYKCDLRLITQLNAFNDR